MPAHTPHIQAHALNLINLIKLHVNTVNRKKADKDTERKKNEQESTEAISRLKSLKNGQDISHPTKYKYVKKNISKTMFCYLFY